MELVVDGMSLPASNQGLATAAQNLTTVVLLPSIAEMVVSLIMEFAPLTLLYPTVHLRP